MAKLEDSRIEETLKQYSGAVLYDTDDPIFDKELKIVLHGSPIIDGRVRMGASGAFYNPQKNEMKKLFRPLYLSDPLLQSIIIDKLMIVKMTLYHQPTIEVAKLLGIAAIESEQFPAITVKDNDNAEKVHWDILHDYNFKVILDDNLIWQNITKKYYSNKERVEMCIQFCSDSDKVHTMYDAIISKSLKYIYARINPKFLRMNNIVDAKNIMRMHLYLLGMQEVHKLLKQKTYKKILRQTLEYYPKECIMAIFQTLKVKGEYLKMNKSDLIDMYIDFLSKDKTDSYTNFYNSEMKLIEKIIGGDINGNKISKCS
jgi:Holliday junction resolvase RusA-like endonuclease